MTTAPAGLPENGPLPARTSRPAGWAQFPRRLLLLLLAWGGSILLLGLAFESLGARLQKGAGELDWALSWTTHQPLADLLAERLPNTLLLVGAAMMLALLLGLAAGLLGVLLHRWEARTGPPASVFKGLGRLFSFALASPPAWALGLILAYLLAYRWKLFPPVGMVSPDGPGAGSLGDRLAHLVLPATALAIFPAVSVGQAATRRVALLPAGGRPGLCGLLRGLGTLLGQMGGILGGSVIVEGTVSWPGLGRAFLQSLLSNDLPVMRQVLTTFALLVLFGRLAAELFRWLERLLCPAVESPPPSPWRRTARTVYVALALALLLVPIGLGVAGVLVDPQAAERMDRQSVNGPPSPDHPWGTDYLGRDFRARVLRGSLISLEVGAFAAIGLLVLGGLYGAAAGALAGRPTLLRESLADLLLWPADLLLFLPAVPAAILWARLLQDTRDGWLGRPLGYVPVIVALALLPRAARAAQSLWLGRSPQQRDAVLDGIGALFFSLFLAAFGLGATLDLVALGVAAPTPSLGFLLQEGLASVRAVPARLLIPGLVFWACCLSLFLAADAMIGYFQDKGVPARLNE